MYSQRVVRKEIRGIKKARAGRGSEPTAPLPDLPVLRQPRNSTETFKINTLRRDKRLSSTELMYLLNTHTWTKLESGLILIIAKSVVEERYNTDSTPTIAILHGRQLDLKLPEQPARESATSSGTKGIGSLGGRSNKGLAGEVKGGKSRSAVL
ncbi:hypothetical protein B0H17DRAFT_1150877 [Mycena rosella]|uniref:Uncharacterized protein n=1 Tax=Mycena rosella TaxID=1033263 RepID=A0AAD7BQI5_MYCRO|nr:hypothetical protein B0H17DRAFT_1150877 [Mycena rosella]